LTNNDILRRLRYTFDLSDAQVIAIFAQGDLSVSREQISNWLKKDDDPALQSLNDLPFASFLNGFISHRRGKKEGEQPKPEKRLNNNMILRKLKIALDLKDVDMLEVVALADFNLSKPELSAFFRKPGHKHYRECKDQVLRNFLNGLQAKYRPQSAPSAD